MADYPAMPLWTDAYLADTTHLSEAEHGRYVLMLIHLWRTPGQRFPNEDGWLARKFHKTEQEVRDHLRPLLSEFFLTDGNWLHHKRVDREFAHLSSTSRKQSDRAKSGWQKRKVESRGNTQAAIPPTPPIETLFSKPESKIPPVSPSGETPPPVDQGAAPPPCGGMTKRDAIKRAVDIWNRACGDLLPQAEALTEQRQRKLAKRLADDFGWKLDAWETYCLRIRASPFCCGVNDRAWRADLDFALAAGTYTKVIEGRYDPRPAKGATAAGAQGPASSGGGTSRSPMAGLRRVLPHLRSYDSGAEEEPDLEPPEVAPKGIKPFLLTALTEGNA